MWLYSNVIDLPYVREVELFTARRRGRPRFSWDGILLGYAEVDGRRPVRRVWWVKPYDRALDPHGVYRTGCPCEAVDPRTIALGVEGDMTPRAWRQRLDAPIVLVPQAPPPPLAQVLRAGPLPSCAWCGVRRRGMTRFDDRRWCGRGPCRRAMLRWLGFEQDVETAIDRAHRAATCAAAGAP